MIFRGLVQDLRELCLELGMNQIPHRGHGGPDKESTKTLNKDYRQKVELEAGAASARLC